jgi:hypothetical protein
LALLLLLANIFLHGLLPESPLSTGFEAWQLSLACEAFNRSRMNAKQIGCFLGIENLMLLH